MHIGLPITLIVLNCTNVALHSLGVYLLVTIYKNGNDTTQMLYLIHLAVSEALMNFLECFRRTSELISEGNIIKEVRAYILIIMFTGISLFFYLVMVYITVDKMMEVVLSIRFPLYWDVQKAKKLLYGTWVIGLCLSVIVSLLHYFDEFVWEDIFFKYFYPILGWTFIIIASITYGFIFCKFKTSTITRRRNSITQVFRKSRFYLPFSLILTFLVFIVIPDMVYLFIGIINGNETDLLLAVCWISYAISNMVDAWIYIFMQPKVRKLLMKMVRVSGRQGHIGQLRQIKHTAQVGVLSTTISHPVSGNMSIVSID